MNSKILVFATMAAGLLIALFLGMAVGEGRRMHIAAVFAVMVGAPILLSLGKNYWYLIPASLLSGLPAIPFGGRNINLAELSIALCFAIFITRVAFKLDKIVLWRVTHIPIYLFMAWVLFIFCLYPSGLAVFGAATMGARFYIKLLLAFMAFVIISSREITNKDCKWIIGFIVGGALINSAYSIFSFFFIGPSDDFLSTGDDDGFYTWHQSLSVPAIAVAFLIFAWKKPSIILQFKKPFLTLIYLIAIALALYSGKRMGLVAVFIAPILGAIIHRQYIYIWLGAFAAVLIAAIVTFGHGEYFRLPIQMQRALSLLPAEWDSELRHMEGGADPFREALRRFAMENINRNPIVGRGFTVEYSEIIGQLMATKYVSGGADSQAAPYAIGRSWHNTWLGYAADFGIPLSVIQAFLYLTVLITSYKVIRIIPPGTPQFIVCGYIFIYVVRDLLASHTSGHTASDAFDRWWMYGVLFAIYAAATAKNPLPLKPQNPREAFIDRLSRNKSSADKAQV
jgi:hypothetical protein